jgi:hypothetical protein
MNTYHETVHAHVAAASGSEARPRARWRRTLLASIAALSLGMQDAAWAVCSDGSTFPAAGYLVGGAHVTNWSPATFTGTLGSVFIPDTSTANGHNWVFDQGATLCKMSDAGSTTAPTGWIIPPTTSPTDCIALPIIKGGKIAGAGDVPGQGDAITPTCNPAILASPANTYFNQLGCSISHGVATTPATAASFLFLAGSKGGLFSVPLKNANATAGKVAPAAGISLTNYYSAIPEGQKLSNATISPNGQIAIATSDARSTAVFACLNPLGDPGDPTKPINPTFTVPAAGTVKCMSVGSNGLQKDVTTQFGPDGQPYFGGQRTMNSFGSDPGGTAKTAWPQCIFANNASVSLADAFANKRGNGCGIATANFGFSSLIQPNTVIHHGQYMYVGPQVAGSITQIKVTTNPLSGLSIYKSRTYLSGVPVTTGLGVADDLGSLMVFTDPSVVGAAASEVVTKLPLCEDMP